MFKKYVVICEKVIYSFDQTYRPNLQKLQFNKLFSRINRHLNLPLSDEPEQYDEIDNENESIAGELADNLENYDSVKASIWYDGLKRDNWTHQSCSRTAKDGITIEVDHILTHSKDGTDDIDNLQVLCKKV
jgi:hypothetical protein